MMSIIYFGDNWIRYAFDALGHLVTVTTGTEGCYVYSDNAEVFVGACDRALQIANLIL